MAQTTEDGDADRPRRAPRTGFGSVRAVGKRFQATLPRRAPFGGKPAPFTFHSRAAAELWLKTYETDWQRGQQGLTDPKAGSITLAAFGPQSIRGRGNRARTKEVQLSAFRNHVEPFLGTLRMRDITPEAVEAWNRQLRITHGATSRTPSAAYATLKAICTDAVRDKHMMSNPCQVKGAAVPPSNSRPYMSPAEATRLLDAIADLDDGRWHAMGVVMAFGGLRVGEASALTLSDIDADRRTVRINKNLSRPAGGPVIGPTKTQAGNRNIELSQSVIDSVQRHISKFIAVQTPTSLLFTSADGGYYHSSNFHRDIWKPALKTARLADKGYHVHDLRHFHGTQLAQLGYSAADIAKRLGDSSLAAALRYIDANPNNDARMAKSLEKMAKKAVKAG